MVKIIKGAWYWLFKDFDIGHSMIPPVQIGIACLYPVWWMIGFNLLAVFIFVEYQIQEYYEKHDSNPETADRAHLALKGYLFGLILSLAIVAIIWRVIFHGID